MAGNNGFSDKGDSGFSVTGDSNFKVTGDSNFTVTPTPTASGPLASLYQNDYGYDIVRYPIEGLGSDDAPHYVTFNINLPENSNYKTSANTVPNVKATSQQNFDMQQSLGAYSQVGSANAIGLAAEGGAVVGAGKALAGQGDPFGAIGGAVQSAGIVALGSTIELQPKLVRIKKTIAIYMPETVATAFNHKWDSVSLTEALGKAGEAGAIGAGLNNIATNIGLDAKSVAKSLWNGDGATAAFSKMRKTLYSDSAGAESIGVLGEAIGAGKDFTALALRGANAALNPLVEMVFVGTGNRQYTMVFDFQPRSAKETAAIQDIIKTFKMYAAAEINKANNGRYFIPPAQFDIKFFFKNTENPNISKVSGCVLTSILIDYNHSGQFATFLDGQPLHINITLQFTEVDIITRELIEKFGY